MSDSILSRWARRKQAVRAAERAARVPAQPPVDRDSPLGAPNPEEGSREAVSPEEADALAEAIARLPRLEDLTAETDLTPFLRAGIPSVLRNAALRRMWSVDPSIRDFVSEAREYAYDWNVPGGVPGLGPMLPTDDIGAMVQRIMTGHAPIPEQTETDTDVVEPELGSDALAGTDDPAGEPEPTIAHAETPPLIPAPEPEQTYQSPTIVSRLRRHGGAMPG